MRVLVTGASGMLGRAVMGELGGQDGVELRGWSFSRGGPGLVSVDLTDPEAAVVAFNDFQPSVVVHCAAERKPDAIGSDPGRAAALNAAATGHLANLLNETEAGKPLLIYVSTDYVFDGTAPPYAEAAVPNPLNDYGLLKLEGEKKVEQRSKSWAILRVPILYGPVEKAGEGAVDVLVKVLKETGKAALVDNLQRRFPTHTADVAKAIAFLIQHHRKATGSVSGIYHFSGQEEMSKCDMVRRMGIALGLSAAHVTANDQEPLETPNSVKRPHNAHLGNFRLAELGFSPPKRNFDEEVKALYSGFV